MELNNSNNAFEMTLLYPEARFVIIDSRDSLNRLFTDGYYYDIYSDFSIRNARVLQIKSLTQSDVLVQYISKEDLAKYYQKNEELVDEKNVRERIIRDISSSKRIIKDEEVEGSLGSISTLTKQLITDNEFFGEDYKLKLLSFLDTWEKMISERQEIDFLITNGYLDQSIKNNFAEPLNTNPMIAAKVYNYILSGLIYRTEEFCERDIKSNEEKHIKVKQ